MEPGRPTACHHGPRRRRPGPRVPRRDRRHRRPVTSFPRRPGTSLPARSASKNAYVSGSGGVTLVGGHCGIYGERGVAVMKLWARVRWLIATATFLTAGGLVWAGTAAQASVPDNWGFAYVNTPSGVPDVNHQAGSWPPGFVVHTTPGAPGEVFVRFPQIASKAGVVHVTAVIDIAVWCQAEHWAASGPDEVVAVRC